MPTSSLIQPPPPPLLSLSLPFFTRQRIIDNVIRNFIFASMSLMYGPEFLVPSCRAICLLVHGYLLFAANRVHSYYYYCMSVVFVVGVLSLHQIVSKMHCSNQSLKTSSPFSLSLPLYSSLYLPTYCMCNLQVI